MEGLHKWPYRTGQLQLSFEIEVDTGYLVGYQRMGAANPLVSGVTQQVNTPLQTVHLSWINRRGLCRSNNKIYFHIVCNVCFHQPILNSHPEIIHQRTGLKVIAESLHIQIWIQPRALLRIAFNTSLWTLLATRFGFCHSSLPRDPMT